MFAAPELLQIKQSVDTKQPLFVRYIAEYGLHCEVIVYFPPEAKSTAEQYLAMPCFAPDEKDLTRL